MRVAFVTGPVPAGRCGVGDYTRQLAAALERKGVRTAVVEAPGPAFSLAFRLSAALKVFRPDVIHLQYPTAGFGRGMTPQLFSFLARFVLTLHEVEDNHLLRRLSLYPLWARARHVIFTCESNRQHCLRWAPWLHRMNSVIPLSSNMPKMATRYDGSSLAEVLYFGLIRPQKGIEEVLEFARLALAEGSSLTVRIVGSSHEIHAAYFEKVRAASAALPVNWDLNLSAEAVADRFARAAIAYLPYPDGASERRTSLLAALANGLAVITTRGRFTPPGLEHAARFCSSPRDAVQAAKELLSNPELQKALGTKARQYAGQFSWESIAESHINIYEQVARINPVRH